MLAALAPVGAVRSRCCKVNVMRNIISNFFLSNSTSVLTMDGKGALFQARGAIVVKASSFPCLRPPSPPSNLRLPLYDRHKFNVNIQCYYVPSFRLLTTKGTAWQRHSADSDSQQRTRVQRPCVDAAARVPSKYALPVERVRDYQRHLSSPNRRGVHSAHCNALL